MSIETLRAAQRQALMDAARWHVQLTAGDGSDDLASAWQGWLASSPQHAWAWDRVEQLHGRLGSVPGGLAFDAFKRAESHGLPRRSLLKGLMIASGVGLGGWASYRSQPAQALLADVHSATGELRSLTLEDGSRLTLDTASAVDLRFDEQQRLIRLRQGRILLTSAKDPQQRPLRVETAEGWVQALGTRFSVSQQTQRSEVEVFEHAVLITPQHGPAHKVEAGESALFSREHVEKPHTLAAAQASWAQGQLIVDNWRLETLIDELGRYRPGLLSCDESLRHLRVSGNFSLTDTDAALSALSHSLDLRIERFSRYWVRVLPA
ncbi:FecR domain-containing protein [Pseudomonas fontis]|uniref:FecR domain-containing protein n=1 Tax=Pseudomonas fontis TaxID=2942633 RepID=A0ABT5NYQ0_9PSED|nr:FecR domain-containing protein [Pseudomonas fontis]MDD0973963.1 FecR domain-containing protein [Pseudomonas fontis]MDD0993329.1 FecR domain-containing protein [Pseudomonas fontis]